MFGKAKKKKKKKGSPFSFLVKAALVLAYFAFYPQIAERIGELLSRRD